MAANAYAPSNAPTNRNAYSNTYRDCDANSNAVSALDRDSACRYNGQSRAESPLQRDGDRHTTIALSVDEERREHYWSD